MESDQRKINQENDQLKKQIDQMRQSFDDHLGSVFSFSRYSKTVTPWYNSEKIPQHLDLPDLYQRMTPICCETAYKTSISQTARETNASRV